MKKYLKFIPSVLFGLALFNFGLNKFLYYFPIPEGTGETLIADNAIRTVAWIVPLAGIAEIIAGLLALFPKTRLAGALIAFPVLTGILLHNVVYSVPSLPMVIILLAINIYVFIDGREKLTGLVG